MSLERDVVVGVRLSVRMMQSSYSERYTTPAAARQARCPLCSDQFNKVHLQRLLEMAAFRLGQIGVMQSFAAHLRKRGWCSFYAKNLLLLLDEGSN